MMQQLLLSVIKCIMIYIVIFGLDITKMTGQLSTVQALISFLSQEWSCLPYARSFVFVISYLFGLSRQPINFPLKIRRSVRTISSPAHSALLLSI